MKIGIIGAGQIGGNLTRRLTGLGHQVSVANSRGPETLGDLAAETGATPVAVTDAARDADVVIVAIPTKNVPDLPDGVLEAAAPGAAIVDTGNYYPQRDGRIADIEEGMPESEWVSRELGRPVIKAFNNMYAHNLIDAARAEDDPERIALPIAGDDASAKSQVMAMVEELGFDAVDAGSLADSWRQQSGTPSSGPELKADDLRTALSEARPQRPADMRG
ncbi:MAG TPA: NAD(P)-binding domain-containing protein [Baekduia sp.]|uniref:NADPH-dependent F420 reductase n=1 Tax=Baekduia sp. TaxID=2600305 RepID=UPI002CAA92DE|nr:NAD(P)-binding domain-containing protein [Baekduia sp.]HMJ36209.1 NAD(P)-binding domain-containing protein [Baekduia sp.]